MASILNSFNAKSGAVTNVTAPQATVLIWNYKDRMAQPGGALSNTQDTEPVYITTASIRSLRVQKTKSSPAGTFEMELAPTYNWIAKATVGSWLAILMTRDTQIDISGGLFNSSKAQQDQVKMLGRIDSVRMVVSVNQETGARQTGFIITGRDWASIFDCTVYLDPLVAVLAEKAPGSALAATFSNLIINYENPKENNFLFSSTECVKAIKHFYGVGLENLGDATGDGPFGKMALIPKQIFHMPKAVCDYFGFQTQIGLTSTKVGDIVEVISGKLVGDDSYDGTLRESVGLPDFYATAGSNNYWQVLVDHSNPVLNELVAEMRWESDLFGAPQPKLALYKRIRPFVVDKNAVALQIADAGQKGDPTAGLALKIVNEIMSEYKFVKKTLIPTEDVILIDAGTNWRDKINFVEILYDDAVIKKYSSSLQSQIKPNARILDENAASREGLKPMILKTKFFPPPDQVALLATGNDIQLAPMSVTCWKHLLRSWYFDTHNMLNGSVTFIGQNKFIGVGENIMIPVKALGVNPNFFKMMPIQANQLFLLAHVESITHQFAVTEDGARSFSSMVQFIRGIFTDEKGDLPLGLLGEIPMAIGAIDSTSTLMGPADESLSNVVRTSTPLDPDTDKFKGK